MDEIDPHFLEDFAFLHEVDLHGQLANSIKADESKCKNASSKSNKCIMSFSFRGYRQVSASCFSKHPSVSYSSSYQASLDSPLSPLSDVSLRLVNGGLGGPFRIDSDVISDIKISSKDSSSTSNIKKLKGIDEYFFRDGIVIDMEEYYGDDVVTIDLITNYGFLSGGSSGGRLTSSNCLVKSLWSNQRATDRNRVAKGDLSMTSKNQIDVDSYLIPLFTRFKLRDRYYECSFMYRIIPLHSCFPYVSMTSNDSNNTINNVDNHTYSNSELEQKISELNSFHNICRFGSRNLLERTIQALGRLDIFPNMLRLRDNCNCNPLEAALEAGRDDNSRLLLSYGGSTSFVGTSGGRKNAVHSAIIGNSAESVKTLLAFIYRNQPIHLSPHNLNLTAFYNDMLEWRDENDMTPLMLACKLLKNVNSEPQIKMDDKIKRLHQRENDRRVEVIKLIVSRGANPTSESSNHALNRPLCSSLALAVDGDSFAAVDFLLSLKKTRAEVFRDIQNGSDVINANKVCLYLSPASYVSAKWKLLTCNPCSKPAKDISIIMKVANHGNIKILQRLHDLEVPYSNEFDLEGNNILQTIINSHIKQYHCGTGQSSFANQSSNCCIDNNFRELVTCIVNWEKERWSAYKRSLLTTGYNICCCDSAMPSEDASRVFAAFNIFEMRNFYGHTALTMMNQSSISSSAASSSASASLLSSSSVSDSGDCSNICSVSSEAAINRGGGCFRCAELISSLYGELSHSFYGNTAILPITNRRLLGNTDRQYTEVKSADVSSSDVDIQLKDGVRVGVDEDIDQEGGHIVDDESDAVEFNLSLSPSVFRSGGMF